MSETVEAINQHTMKGVDPQGETRPVAVNVDGSVRMGGRALRVVDYTSATIANTAGTLLTLADSGMVTGIPDDAESFVGVLETAQVRARGDNTDPSTTEGQVIEVGSTVYLSRAELATMRFIRTGATSGVLKGHFYNLPVADLLGA